MPTPEVDAILFDVFGTVVDWRSGIIRDGRKLNREKNLDVDWAAFADAWREEYRPSMDRVRQGELPWTKLNALHRNSLKKLLDRFEINDLSEEETDHLNRVWHRLDPWPDSVAGLRRLRKRYFIASLSNGNMRLLANMAKRAGLPWDLILSAELSRHYKPDEETYLTCVDFLNLTPEQVLMVACHDWDLDGAGTAGLQTAYVHRPLEWGPQQADTARQPDESGYDIVANDIVDLAEKLGA